MGDESRVTRVRRESGTDDPVGAYVRRAAEEAATRVGRAVKGPPPTEAEQELIAAAPHEPARLFTRVLVTDLETGEREEYRLVPHDEADLGAGKISIGSPLGRALLEEYPGALVMVKAPAGKRLYRILRVD